MSTVDALVQMMNQIERFTLARVWDDLSDDEMHWEPAEGTWGIRPRAESRTGQPFGDGDVVADFGRWGEGPEPLTTIAWLLWHVGSMPGRLVETEVFGGPHTVASGWHSPYLSHHEMARTAGRAVENLRGGWDALRSAVESATEDDLARPAASYTYAAEPPAGGVCALGPPGDVRPGVSYVVGTLNEVSHHGSQICTLRDVYAHRHALRTGA
jgi:hypothetical protein